MLGKIKAFAALSLLAATLAAPSVAQADAPAGAVLLDSGDSTYHRGFLSGPHRSSDLWVQARFKGFGITPSTVHLYLAKDGEVVQDCTPAPVYNGEVTWEITISGDLEVGFCEEFTIPEGNKAFSWEVYDVQ